MKNKNKLKLVLDAVMLILLLCLFKKNSISLDFHERAGLAAIAIMFVHFFLNFAWVRGITAKFFSKGLSAKVRIGYVINALMFLDLILLAASAVLISKRVFHNSASPAWIRLHFFAAWLLVTLAGFYLGLHFKYIRNTLSARRSRAGSVVFIAAFSVIAIFGVHSVATSSYARQISAPFAALIQAEDDGHEAKVEEEDRGRGQGMGKGLGRGRGQGRMQSEYSAKSVLKSVWQVLSIMALYAMIAFGLSELAMRRKERAARRMGTFA